MLLNLMKQLPPPSAPKAGIPRLGRISHLKGNLKLIDVCSIISQSDVLDKKTFKLFLEVVFWSTAHAKIDTFSMAILIKKKGQVDLSHMRKPREKAGC